MIHKIDPGGDQIRGILRIRGKFSSLVIENAVANGKVSLGITSVDLRDLRPVSFLDILVESSRRFDN